MADKRKVLVLGTGFGALRFLKGIDHRLHQVTVISPRNHFLFTPLLASTTVGTIEFRSIIEPIRSADTHIQYLEATAEAIDRQSKILNATAISEERSISLPYDDLVISVGASNNTFDIPGVVEHALFLKELADARTIRQKLLGCLEGASVPDLSPQERSRLLHIVVIGGGPTGIEFAAEVHDLINEEVARFYPALKSLARISVFDANDRILGGFDERLSEYTIKSFRNRNIEVHTKSLVSGVEANALVLKDGTRVSYGLAVWTAGLKPTPFVEGLNYPKSTQGRLLVDDYLKVKGVDSIYAIGDCASLENHALPATAQVAQQQGKYLAKSFNCRAKGRKVVPFSYHHLGMLAYIGDNRAIADLPGVKGKGFIAWLFWRSIYITKLVSLKNKILVLFDWLKTTIFGRDLSRF